MSNVIHADQLTKKYGRLAALDNINLNIARGQIVGLFGPNGAGKTTLLKAMLGLTSYQGNLAVLGLNPRKKRSKLMQNVSFIADVAILPPWLKVNNAIEFVNGVHPKFNPDKAHEFLARTKINQNSKVRTLSKGMIAQLHLALVMAIDADILVLDEPTLGLDIIYRKTFYQNLLNDYFNENRTIIIATHQVEEVESLLTNLIMLDKGNVILNESMQAFSERYTYVTAKSDNINACRQLNPIHEEQQFGQTKFLFENTDKNTLQQLGEITAPSISDVFVAKVSGEKS